jgi:DNA (cytosine-5)-methyltransferase 1
VSAYYNEIDPFAAQWLRNLIAAGHIAPGEVDERDIRHVAPCELEGFTQCHFFAGIGVWSYALRLAGWPDERPAWTGSCPCQPFSSAGKRGGFDDDRHLWPAWFELIKVRKPEAVFGEQVASPDGRAWFDLVSSDLESLGYAAASIDFCSAGVGAPHIRQRQYFAGLAEWVADASSVRRQRRGASEASDGFDPSRIEPERLCDAGRMADTDRAGRIAGQSAAAPNGHGRSAVADGGDVRPGPVNGFWRAADWLSSRDGKWRGVEPGTFPLAHGAAARVGRLRAYGNALNAEQAKAFIGAVLEVAP